MELIANWLWQGSVVALTTAAVLRVLVSSTPQVRYLVCWASLVAALALPLAPSIRLGASSPHPDLEVVGSTSAALVTLPNTWRAADPLIIAALAIWSAFQALRLAGAMAAFRRTKHRCSAFPTARESRLPHWARVKEAGRRARLMVSADVTAAALLGGRQPVIAVAPAVLDRLSDDELDRVVVHEWAHVQRRDDVFNTVQLIARVIAGWHPAVWWLDRRLQAEREAACDHVAVAITGSAKAYAGCLVKLAGLPRAGSEPLPAVGATSSPSLTTRIETVLSARPRLSPRWSKGVAATAVVLLFAVSFAVGSMDLVDSATFAPTRQRSILRAARPSTGTDMLLSNQGPDARARTARRTTPQLPPSARRRSVAGATVRAAGGQPPIASDSLPPVTPSVVTLPAIERSPAAVGTALPPSAAPAARETAAASPPPRAQDTPWSAAADAGVAVGRGSKKAGLATAGFFTRISKGIARSFTSGPDARTSR